MIVYAYQLRKQGVKLTRDQLDRPVRAHLVIERGGLSGGVAGEATRRCITAYLHVKLPPPFPGYSYFPPLSDARVTRLDARGLVIVGTEAIFQGGYSNHLQAWACLLTEPGGDQNRPGGSAAWSQDQITSSLRSAALAPPPTV